MSRIRPSDYLGAVIPLPVRVIGTRLKPFSLGHYMLLERSGCAFVCGGIPTIGDLLLGIVVCSSTYEEALEKLDSHKAKLQSTLLGWRVRLSGVSLFDSIVCFRNYITEGMNPPSFWEKENDSRKIIDVPLPLLVKVYLQKHLGYSDSEAMNKPFGAALHEYGISLNLDGIRELVGENAALATEPLTEEEKAELRRVANGV